MLCTISFQSQSQKANNLTKKWWLSSTFGVVPDQKRMPAGGITFNRSLNSLNSIAVRTTLGGELFNSKSPGLKFTDLGVLYGLSVKRFYLGAGLSWLQGVKRGIYLSGPQPADLFPMFNYQKVKYSTVGIPYEIRWIPLKSTSFGIGISLNGNFSNQFTYTAIGLSIYGGKL
jgi:hypothetical protein